MSMKMARARQEDMDSAMKLYRILSAIDGGNFPPASDDDDEWPVFNEDNTGHLQEFLELVLDCYNNPPSGIMRVLMAASCALDPNNRLYDEKSDVLAFHPRIEAGEKLVEAAESFRDCVLHQRYSLEDNGMTSDQVNDVLNLFDTMFGEELDKCKKQTKVEG